MSSILDALKKLEEEKARQASSGLEQGEMDLLREPTQHGGGSRSGLKQFLLYAVAALILVSVSVMASVWVMQQNNTPPQQANNTPEPTTPAVATTPAEETPAPEPTAPEATPPASTPEVQTSVKPEEPVVVAQATPPPAQPAPTQANPTSPAPEPAPVVEKPAPVQTYTPPPAKPRPRPIPSPAPVVVSEVPRNAAPVVIEELPILRAADVTRLGLDDITINLLRPPGDRRPIGLAIINLDKVYVGDKIPGTSARLIGVSIEGIAVESTTSGAQYFFEK